jgi:hypothetical protein
MAIKNMHDNHPDLLPTGTRNRCTPSLICVALKIPLSNSPNILGPSEMVVAVMASLLNTTRTGSVLTYLCKKTFKIRGKP